MSASDIAKIIAICKESGGVSQFFPYGGLGYKHSVGHWLYSSCEVSAAAVQPGRTEDLIKIMAVLSTTQLPFAIKGGGHATNPKFSSTVGIQISLTRFNDITYDEQTTNVRIGAGCLFEEVYRFLELKGRGIVGGSGTAGVGVGGWLLGGGYSLRTNQYGLGIDRIVGIRVILPSGEERYVEEGDQLFTALKGGGNNFGIVTEFTLQTHAQVVVYGGVLRYKPDNINAVKIAIDQFTAQVKDPKAAIVAAFRHRLIEGQTLSQFTVQCFYDGPKPQPDPFQGFLNIPHTGNLTQLPFADLDQLFSSLHNLRSGLPPMEGIGEVNARGRWGTVMVSYYPPELIELMQQLAQEAASSMAEHQGRQVVIDIWPFLSTMFDNSSPAAWPHKKGHPNGPLLVYFLWDEEANDEFWIGLMKKILQQLKDAALSLGCTTKNAAVYCNTALDDTPVGEIYQENLIPLKGFRREYDPGDVMGRTGGFRIPLS